MADEELFSKRHGFAGAESDITIREDAPVSLRYWVQRAARKLGMWPDEMRTIVCEVVRTPPDPDNYSADYVNHEIEVLLSRCPWYRVYDIIEAFYRLFEKGSAGASETAETDFQQEMNDFFREKGIGWKMVDGHIVSRGSEEFETGIETATTALEEAHYQTASREIHQAIADLSRRPEADLTGAIQHAMAAMECVAREFCGEPQPTFGKLIERHPDMLPRPLNQGVEKAWGYASEMGRHVREGRVPEREEAELVVGLAAIVSTYLTKKRARQQE
jgi:hypothetical protein